MARIGIYPGTFDPITKGHMDVIARAATNLVDELIISVAVNAGKGPLFTLDERVSMVEQEIAKLDVPGKITVVPFEKLLMHHAQDVNANMIVRGLRAVSDFDYEFQMTGMNAKINKKIETVFLMASETNQFIASRLVKEVSALGGDVSQFVSPAVESKLKQKQGL